MSSEANRTGENGGFDFGRYRDKTCPDSHVELRADTMQWLADRDETADHVIRLEAIRRENQPVFRRFMAAISDDTERDVIAKLVRNGGQATYTELDDAIDGVSRKTIKRAVWSMRDDEALKVGDGKPAVVTFPDEPTELLAADSLSFLPSFQERKNERKKDTLHTHNTHTDSDEYVANRTDSVPIENQGEYIKENVLDSGGVDPFAHVEIEPTDHEVAFETAGELE